MSSSSLLCIKDLYKTYGSSSWFSRRETSGKSVEDLLVLRGLNVSVEQGQIYGLLGESGCGKTTTARIILGLEQADAGEIWFDGVSLLAAKPAEARLARRNIQFVFQDALSSFNPRVRIGKALEESLMLAGAHDANERRQRAIEHLEQVGLSRDQYFRFPHECSGGQIQRLGLARALVHKPKLLICDEPVSALDVSIQAQILNLLRDLRKTQNLTIVFISHDIAVVRYLADVIGVMQGGTLVEEGPSDELLSNPSHAYTQKLIASLPENCR